MDVIIVGAGIGGLRFAFALHQRRSACRGLYASAASRPIGVVISLLPHSTRELASLGLEEALARVAITTLESCFYNRFGQLIHKEPLGRYADYDWPQFNIHRGDLQTVLHDAFKERIGPERLTMGARCVGVEQDAESATAHFVA